MRRLRLRQKKGRMHRSSSCSDNPLTVRNPLEHVPDIHVQDPLVRCGRDEVTRSSISKLEPYSLVLEEKGEEATSRRDQRGGSDVGKLQGRFLLTHPLISGR
jgi:hypothetical protein